MKRAKFSLSHWRLASFHFGTLIPITWYEALPGDTIQHGITAMVRAAPMVTPAMHTIDVRFHCFFVPNRIMWTTGGAENTGWEDYITGGQAGTDNQAHPSIASNTLAGASGNNAGVSTLGDFLGVPTAGLAAPQAINALPFRAYDMIWNEFYRDQDLQTALVVNLGNGTDATTSTSLQNCAWEKDYLTTSRSQESKGPAVTMFAPGAAADLVMQTTTNSTAAPAYPGAPAQATNAFSAKPAGAYLSSTDAVVPGAHWFVDLGGSTNNVDINQLRVQFAVQRFQENRTRWGSRYTEMLAYYGIRSSDARLQRPEYLGGGRSVIQISEVLQTSNDGTAAHGQPGTMFGHGISGIRTPRYRRFFEEHGIVMCMLSIRPRSMYSQRTQRALLRGQAINGLAGTKFDYFHPELQFIGQQGVNGLEADAQVGNGATWGFQDRYDEYRRIESSVHGQFRSSLDNWHLSREFGSAPALNSTFVSCVPSPRIFADTTNDNFYCLVNHHITARRLLRKSPSSKVF